MNFFARIAVAACAFGMSLTSNAQTPLQRAAESTAARQWADSVLNTLTMRQRVGQLMCPKVVPTNGKVSRATIKKLIADQGCGSVLFTEGSLAQYVDLINYAQSIAKVPVMFTLDGEWGLAMRIKNMPKYPRNMPLGAIRDTALIYAYGRETARQCRLAGIHVNFAPVADVNSNPRNPVIGTRSFGSDPVRVSSLVNAYSRGLEDNGVQAVAKHFPGHGDTDGDSHKMLPAVNRSMAQMNRVELLPFRRFANNAGSGVMVAHMSVPAIDKSGVATSLTPATYRLLRDDIGFRGLVYTDAMGMKGAVMPDGGNNCVAALAAGADVIECRNAVTDIDAVMQAIKAGKITEQEINRHCLDVLRYKYALGLDKVSQTDIKGLAEKICTPGADSLNRALNRAMMTAVVNKDNTLPLGGLDRRDIAVVNIGAKADNTFADYCGRYAKVQVYGLPQGSATAGQLAAIKKHDTVILAVYKNDAASRATFAALEKCNGVIAVFFTSPYQAARFVKGATPLKALLMAYEDMPLTQEYAAQAVFGGIDVDGVLPVDLGSVAKAGTGVSYKKTRLGYSAPVMQGMRAQLADSVDSIVNKALAAGAMPGCQVLVARNGNVVLDKAYGKMTPGGAPVTHGTLYDLASVSKALGTLPGVMLAADRGLLDVDSLACKYIPQLVGGDKAGLTLRQLLYHESGMPPSVNMFDVMVDTASYTGKLIVGTADVDHGIKIQKGAYGHNNGRLRSDIVSTVRTDRFCHEAADGLFVGQAAMDTIMNRIYHIELRPTKKYTYSCLNFCMLMHAEQNATGVQHDTWCRQNLWAPLGAWSVTYRPYERFDKSQIAPTEHDTYLRRQHVHAHVHDETAAFSGGLQGNAGLFANAGDLAKICQMWLDGGQYGGQRYLKPETVSMFTTQKSPTCRRGLGFDKPDVENLASSPTCDEAPADTYGHLGFTGTVFWVVPSEQLIFIFLTNRVDPTRDNAAFNAANLRPALMQAALKAIDK